TFWGKAWNRNLEAYSDYENRLPRGRTYLRQSCVLDLEIGKGEVTSTVQGSELYEVRISIKPLSQSRWTALKKDCSGRIGSLVELLGGKLSDDIMAHVTSPKEGLFPSPKEIQIVCSCPDYAGLCKHAAATLYGVSVRLDDEPGLLFTLRGVDAGELIGSDAVDAINVLTTPEMSGGEGVLASVDLADVFGISFDLPAMDDVLPVQETEPVAAATKVTKKKKTVTKKKKKKKKRAKS
ncbi:MAG: SWIM zinc finger family protein, partial [Verrucomicrobium sp.]